MEKCLKSFQTAHDQITICYEHIISPSLLANPGLPKRKKIPGPGEVSERPNEANNHPRGRATQQPQDRNNWKGSCSALSITKRQFQLETSDSVHTPETDSLSWSVPTTMVVFGSLPASSLTAISSSGCPKVK